MRRVLLLLLLALGCSCGSGTQTPGPRRAVMMSLDGFPARLFHHPLVRQNMPALLELVEQRGTAFRSLPSFPSNTATSHAALWTGAWGGVSGITGNTVLEGPGEFTFLDTLSGYSAIPLEAEPLFVTTARQGIPTLVVTATQTYPYDRFFHNSGIGLSPAENETVRRNLTLLSPYDGRLHRGFALERGDLRTAAALPNGAAGGGSLRFEQPLSLGLSRELRTSPLFGRRAEARLSGWWFASGEQGYDRLRLLLEGAGDPVSLDVDTTGRPFLHLPMQVFGLPGGIPLKIVEADPWGSAFQVLAADPYVLLASDQEWAGRILSRLGGLTGNGAAEAYGRGLLGPLLAQGGDGRAEERYLESVLQVIDRFNRLWQLAAEREWQVAFAYVPYPDELLHEWYGWLDPRSPAHDPALAGRMEPLAARMFSALDDYVATIVRSLGPQGLLILGSDHGMRPTTRAFYPNRLLARAGLLELDRQGRIDPARSRARYLTTFQIALNTGDHAQSTVGEEEVGDLVDQVARLLLSARDPETGAAIVDRVILPDSPEGRRWGVGRPGSGHIFFDVRPPFYCSGSTRPGPVAGPARPAGSHGFHPDHEDMHALMVVAGPGAKDLSGERVRNIDAAPTLCDWLGIEPPRHAAGRSLLRRQE